MQGQGVVSSVFYFMFVLILAFLVFTNYKGMTAIMQQSGNTLSQVSKTLQGR